MKPGRIQADEITAAKIVDNEITADKIPAVTITASMIRGDKRDGPR